MELITEYDSVIKNMGTRALYYSKFSENFSVSLDMSRFKGLGQYDSGIPSWGSSRYLDLRTGSSAVTSEYGREVYNNYTTDQRIWFGTNNDVSQGKAFPNYNLNITYKDFSLKSTYMSKLTSWVPPQVDGAGSGNGNFGGDTVYGSPRNNRIWGVGYVMLDWNPTSLSKYELSFRIFRQLNINSDYREKDYQGFSTTGDSPGGSNSNARMSSPIYLNYMLANGGGIIKKYASTSYANGIEFQATPYKFESKSSFINMIRFMVGGNFQNVQYINYQKLEALTGIINATTSGVPRYNQGIGNDGKQIGLWNQISLSLSSGTFFVFGLRYDAQKINNVYRHQNGNSADIAVEAMTDPVTKATLNSGPAFNDPIGNRALNGYSQPFQRKDIVSEDKTPRIAFIQNLKQTGTTVKLMYAEAFRMVTPQEVIRLPRDLGNAQSEKVKNNEINIIQSLFGNKLTLTVVYFWLRGSTIYAFNAANSAFGQTPRWSNDGGTLSATFIPDDKWRIMTSFTSYKLRRPSDVSFLNVFFTPSPQALNSPTNLWKAAISRSVINDQYSISLEYYFNSAIFLMQQPPTNIVQTLNPNLSLYDKPPLPQETASAASVTGLGPGIGSGATVYRVWKVPPSQFFNLTFSSNINNNLILVISAKNVFNQKVYYPLDLDSGSFTAPTMDPHQLMGFGKEFFFKLGYRF